MKNKKITINLMMPLFIVVGILLALYSYVSWATFGLILLAQCKVDITWIKQ